MKKLVIFCIIIAFPGVILGVTFEVISEYDSPVPPVGIHEYDIGDTIRAYLNHYADTTFVSDSMIIWYCIGYYGTGDIPSGTGTGVFFTITYNSSIEWIWVEAGPTHLPFTIYNANPCEFDSTVSIHLRGTPVTALVPPALTCGDTRYRCTGWLGTGSVPDFGTACSLTFWINYPSTIEWKWEPIDTTLYLTVISEYGDPVPPVGIHEYEYGDTVIAWTSTIDTIAISDSTFTKYCCLGHLGTGSVSPEPYSADTFVILENSTIEWFWYNCTFTHPILVIGENSPCHFDTVAIYRVWGDLVRMHVPGFITCGDTGYTCIGWTGTGSVPESGSDTTVAFNIFDNSTITWHWQLQWPFDVTGPPEAHPIPGPGRHWYDDSSEVYCRIDSISYDSLHDDYYYCIGYYGNGSVPAVGTGNELTFEITEPSSIAWRWSAADSVFMLIVNSDYGDPSPPYTTYWLRGGEITASVDSIVYFDDTMRYVCTGWTGTGSVPDSGSGNIVTFEIDTHSTITWQWQLQWPFDMTGPLEANPIPEPGRHWYDDSSNVFARVDSTYYDTLWGCMWCIGFTGSGSVPVTSPWYYVDFIINQPSGITWLWAPDTTVYLLTVVSEYGDPDPCGDTYWGGCMPVDACINYCEVIDSETVAYCRGWIGTGSVPDSGTDTTVSFIMETNSTLTWIWEVVDEGIKEQILPSNFEISIYPNPFNGAVSIEISGVGAFHETPPQLEIYDINGKAVGRLDEPNRRFGLDGWVENPGAPVQRITWTPEPATPSGIYLIQVKNPNQSVTKKVLYLK
ncbi:T9SS type A sorting domain-containing protein [bacterium]|nr:T9SS type A sorting domain-containing protein [bacterium]